MSVEVKKMDLTDTDVEKISKIQKSLENLKNKHNKFMFVMPDVKNPNASMYEVYFHATTVKKMGYHVIILTDNVDYEIPKWIDKELTDFEHIPMSDNKLSVSPEDFMIIPEIYSNVMEQVKNLPCKRIMMLNSIDYMFNALLPGMSVYNFNITDIITPSTVVKDFLLKTYGKNLNIKTYKIGIPEYFKDDGRPKKPVISIVGRNPNEIAKIVKHFYAKYPQYNWISFDPMMTKSKPPQPLRRKDFAERLKENFAAVWVDRISSFGTFPLECMKAGTIPVCLKPDITPEYILKYNDKGEIDGYKDNIGVWTESFYDLADLIADLLIKFLDDIIIDDLYVNMYKNTEEYTVDKSESDIKEIYNSYIENRVEFFEGAIPETVNENK